MSARTIWMKLLLRAIFGALEYCFSALIGLFRRK